MKYYTAYIAKSLILPLLLSVVTLTSIIWLTQSFRYVSLIMSSGVGLLAFFKLAVLMIPSLMLIILPISTFISVIYLYHRLTSDSEIVVLRGAGLSNFAIARPALVIALFTTIIGYIICLYLLPISYRDFKDKLVFYRDNYASVLLEDGVFNTKVKDLTIYIEEHMADGMLKNILVYDNRDKAKPTTMMATSGKLIKNGRQSQIELYDGTRQELDNTGQLAILYFDNFTYDLSLEASIQGERAREMQERSWQDLLYPKGVSAAVGNKFKAEAHQRLTWPLYNIILTIFALIAVNPAEFNRRGQSKVLFIYSAISLLLVLVYFLLNNLIASSPLWVPIFYANIMVTAFIGIKMLFGSRLHITDYCFVTK